MARRGHIHTDDRTHRIVFLDRASIEASVRRPRFPHDWVEYPNTRADEVVDRLQGATIAIANKTALRTEALTRLPHLELVAACATGTNNIDLEACRERGIVVSNIRDYAIHSVVEHVFMLMLSLRRNLMGYHDDVRRGLWQQSESFCLFTHGIRDLHGSTLGIIGFGSLGRAVARLAKALGMQVLIAERKHASTVRPGFTPFVTVLQQSDVITLHTPLTPATRNLIGEPELRQMRRDALLINCARGGVVDELALAHALHGGVIAGAGFDVLSEEPPSAGNALLELDLPNFILTPHVAWASEQAMQSMADQLIENIEAFAGGTPRNRVV